MTYNPNTIFISPSSISAFKSCPRAYYYQQVYKNPKTGLKIQVINPKLALGSVVHDTLAQFLHTPGVVKKKDQLLNILTRYWSNITGEKGGFLSPAEENQYKDRALKMLETFWANQHFRSIDPVKMPDFPRLDLGDDLTLTGKLDWIEKEGEDKYHIIDFKTGEKEERNDSIQLPTYAVLATSFLKSPRIRASYWYLDKEKELRPYNLPDLTDTLNELRKIGLIIKNSRLTNSFRCGSGFDSCWACRSFKAAVEEGRGELVSVDYTRKQEIYIISPDSSVSKKQNEDYKEDLPF